MKMNAMKKWLAAVAIGAAAMLAPQPAQAYIEAPHPLGMIVAQATNIVLMKVEKVDTEKNLIIYRKVRDIKGTHPTDVIKHNIAKAGFHPREWQFAMSEAKPGSLAVFFHNGSASETFNGYWYQAYPGDWWAMSHGEPFLLRSYAGKVEKLVPIVEQIMAGKEVIVPAMIDDKPNLHLRSAKIQRLKASLKIQDYNPKRDFCGWGNEDFRAIAGMPAFSQYTALTRTDPEAGGVATADFDGDGKLDVVVYGAGKVALLKNAGSSFDEVTLPYAGGARAASFGDWNGDGKPDLLLATPTGPVLLTNAGGGAFKDDTALLPKESYYALTSAAWIDADADGKQDILLANGYLGLRLYRNTGAGVVAKVDPLIGRERELIDEMNFAEEAAKKAPDSKDAKLNFTERTAALKEWQKANADALAKAKAAAGAAPVAAKPTGPSFEDVSDKMGLGKNGIAASAKGFHLAVADLDGDGRQDFVYSANGGVLVRNTPGGFVAVADSGIAFKAGKVAPVVADFDGDGKIDVTVVDGNRIRLFKNQGGGKFSDISDGRGDLSQPIENIACLTWTQFEPTGGPGLMVGVIKGSNRYFRSPGDGRFIDASEEIGLNQRVFNTRAMAVVDLNGDKAPDVIFNNEGTESAILLGDPKRTAKKPAGAE